MMTLDEFKQLDYKDIIKLVIKYGPNSMYPGVLVDDILDYIRRDSYNLAVLYLIGVNHTATIELINFDMLTPLIEINNIVKKDRSLDMLSRVTDTRLKKDIYFASAKNKIHLTTDGLHRHEKLREEVL